MYGAARPLDRNARNSLENHVEPPNIAAHPFPSSRPRPSTPFPPLDRASKIDVVVALAMAVERQAFKPEPVELVGWL
jgi:hypothetical protein